MRRTLALIVSCWALLWPIAAMAETDVIRIPRGAGASASCRSWSWSKRGLSRNRRVRWARPICRADWIKLGGPAVVNDLLLSGAADVVVAGPPAFLTLWDRTRETTKVKGHRRHELDPDVSQHPRGALSTRSTISSPMTRSRSRQ